MALLVKIQTHRELSKNEYENNSVRNASFGLNQRLKKLELPALFEHSGADSDTSFPVLLAARAMQSLVTRARTVFHPETMYCYYRIIRELYGVAHPNWTVGAARAAIGGTTSAFVTNECVRAIFAFERSLQRTCKFFQETLEFYRYFSSLERVVETWSLPTSGPLYRCIDKSLEARWLDCQIATNPRNREMALFLENEGDEGNALLLPEGMIPNYVSAANYFNSLQATLQAAVGRLCEDISGVHSRIKTDRDQEKGGRAKEEQFIRSETGHLFGLRVIENAVEKARTLEEIIKNGESAGSESEKKAARKHFLEETLKKLAEEFYRITRSVYHVLHPSKQYLRWVLDRELAAPREMFDAGELVFAATSYGAIQKWRLDNRLTRACEMLVESLPDNGRLPTKRPFHADRRGYRVIPIGCEMTRALATLMQKTAHHFDAKFVGKMLGVFEGQLIELHESTADKTLIGWNFEGAPDPDKPAVWVTAVSVLALDRIVRMLNTRINEIVLAHFDVTQPDRPHRELRLRDLIYADYALVRPDFHEDEEKFVAIHLQKARAHVMRATLPKRYRSENKNFSTIYYGPPNTGKTTFAQSLAFSAEVPLLRLSPGDLILQGQELIEGRAHDVFEALSMVTQCVIIFDEFEPVLKSRRSERKSSPKQMVRIGNLLEKISEKDDPKFKFVLGGMLPKLIKLHDSAEQQTFAYCLGTNYFSKIDLAAKRRGRFDKSLPVYKPDSLSRAGALLCRLGEAKKSKANGSIIGDVDELRRFFEVIARTVGEPADRISKLFGSEKSDGGEDRPAGTLRYILKDEGEPPSELKELGRNLETLKKEIRAGELEKGKDEQKQCEWIVDYETSIVNETRNTGTKTAAEIITLLNECLNGDKVRREPKARRHNLRSN